MAGSDEVYRAILEAIKAGLDSVTGLLTGASAAVPTNVSVITTSTVVLAAKPARKMATFHNDGGGVIYLKLGAGASTTSFTARIADNGYYELPLPIYTGVIEAAAAAGTRVLRVTEY